MEGSPYTAKEEVDESIRKRRDNSTQVLQRLDNLHNAIERYGAWSDEADRLEGAEEPLKSRMALPAGIAVETTLRDRYTLERELEEWADRVARRDPDEVEHMINMREVIASVDASIDDATDPVQMGRSVRAAVAILQEYGAKQMLLARAFERRELSSDDLARRVVRGSQTAREAVAREVERCNRSTPAGEKRAKALESLRNRTSGRAPGRRSPFQTPTRTVSRSPHRRGSGHTRRHRASSASPAAADGNADDEAQEEMAALRYDEMAAQLDAAKAAQRATSALVEDLEKANQTMKQRLQFAEDDADASRRKISQLKVLLERAQEAQLHSSDRNTVAVQASSTVLRSERGVQTDYLSALGDRPSFIASKPSFRSRSATMRTVPSSSAAASPRNTDLQSVAPMTTSGAFSPLEKDLPEQQPRSSPGARPRAAPTLATEREDPNSVGASWQWKLVHGSRLRPTWTPEAVTKLFECFTRERRRLKAQLTALRFCFRLGGKRGDALGGAPSQDHGHGHRGGGGPGGGRDRSAMAKVETRRLRDNITQLELKMKYREKELSRAIEKQYAMTSEIASLKKRVSDLGGAKAVAESNHDDEEERSAAQLVEQLPTKALEVVGMMVSAWRGVRSDIGRRVHELVKISYESESAARIAAIDRDLELLSEADGYFLGAVPRLETLSHPLANTIAAEMAKVADGRERDASALGQLKAKIRKRTEAAAKRAVAAMSPKSRTRRNPAAAPPPESGGDPLAGSTLRRGAATFASTSGVNEPGSPRRRTSARRSTVTVDSATTSDAMPASGMRSQQDRPPPPSEMLELPGGEDSVVGVSCSPSEANLSPRQKPASPVSAARRHSAAVSEADTRQTPASAGAGPGSRSGSVSAVPRSVLGTSAELDDDDDDSLEWNDDFESYVAQKAAAVGGTGDAGTARVEYRASRTAPDGVVQVASRATQCGPSAFGLVELTTAHLKRLKRRVRRGSGSVSPSRARGRSAEGRGSPSLSGYAGVAAAGSRTRTLTTDRTLLSSQVSAVCRGIVARSKARVLTKASQSLATMTKQDARARKRLEAMISRHETAARRFDEERVSLVLERAAALERLVKLDAHGLEDAAVSRPLTPAASPSAAAAAEMISPVQVRGYGKIDLEAVKCPSSMSQGYTDGEAADAAPAPSVNGVPGETVVRREDQLGALQKASPQPEPRERRAHLMPAPPRTSATIQSRRSLAAPSLSVGSCVEPHASQPSAPTATTVRGQQPAGRLASRPGSAKRRPTSAAIARSTTPVSRDAVLTPRGVAAGGLGYRAPSPRSAAQGKDNAGVRPMFHVPFHPSSVGA